MSETRTLCVIRFVSFPSFLFVNLGTVEILRENVSLCKSLVSMYFKVRKLKKSGGLGGGTVERWGSGTA